MWLREEQWRKEGVRDAITITYLNNLPGMFHVKKYSEILGKMADDKKVQRMHKHDLVKIDKVSKVATFKNQETGALVTKPFDAMHVTPYMSPPDVIKKSPIANETGYIPVNKETMQHVKYPNIFALGDSAGIPTSKTAAAVGSQAPVVVSNLLHASKKETLTAKYDGYSSCPLLVGDKKLVLAEFLWAPELKVNETFPWDQGKPSSLLFYMKKDFFPYVYWNFFVKGSWYGHNAFWRPSSAN
jgi:NADPH-dependent 2,4-dienoyl-CoA reductase/sulfur reductase-like enzyme